MPPYIVLIGGPPGAGKTTLGRGLAIRLGYPSLSVDDLSRAIRSVTTASSHPPFHVMPTGHVDYFTNSTPEQLIENAIALEAAIWPAVEQLIRSRLRSGEGVVIDWWLLPPSQVAAVTDEPVRSLWLHIEPVELDRRERTNGDFRIGSPDGERMHANFMARSLWRNEFIAAEAARLKLPLLHQTGAITRDELVDLAVHQLG